jgi:acetyl-CoA synthetase
MPDNLDLYREVNDFAAGLRSLGIEEDDVVTLFLPMIPELPIAMLACARLGAPHSVVFAGFSAEALATRMNAADSEYLITCDGYLRRGEHVNQKSKADKGLRQVDHDVSEVVVVDRLDDRLKHFLGDKYHDYDELREEHAGETVEPVERDAEDMLFLMYTSGTTGEPKGVTHTTGGYLSHAAWTSHAVLDLKPEDTYWCAADIGWITGHSYIVYGPLALGATTVMYEGAPDYPAKDRLWEIAEKNAVDVFYTAPTAIRSFMKWGEEYPSGYDLSSIRLLGTVGEPINPRPWHWYYEHIGGGDCAVVDTWWQTETGGMMVTTLPAIDPMKPGAAGPPLPGIDARVVDSTGDVVDAGEAGYLTINTPWPGMLRTLYGNDDRYLEEYWTQFSEEDDDQWVYAPEDSAKIDDEGYITVLGRVDDVINVAGHRLGTMELESAIVDVHGVAEAAVVGADHDVKGNVVFAFVIPEDEDADRDALREQIEDGVEDAIGSFARPEGIVFCPDLPKTRSGKIMRRLLETVASGQEIGDTSTLRNPDVVSHIQEQMADGDEENGNQDPDTDADSGSSDSDSGDSDSDETETATETTT